MQSTYLSRSLFGCTRILLITAALFVGTMALAGQCRRSRANEVRRSRLRLLNRPAWPSTREMPTSLRELVQEAEQKNPQIAASFHAWQASRNVPKQVSALPETQLSVQQFSVGSPRPFAGYSNSDFAYIGFGASQDIPYPGKRQLRAQSRRTRSGLHGSADRFSPQNGRGKSQDGLFPTGLHSANPRRSAEK